MEDKSLSESNIFDQPERTPPNYVSYRNKRGRENDYETDFDDFKDEMKTLITNLISSQNNELQKIHPTLMEIKNTNSNIENSVAFLAAQNEELKKKIEQLEAQNKKDKDRITILEDKIDELQCGNRKSNLEIKNVPKGPNESKEDLINMVINLSTAVHHELEKKDINDIYRVQNKRGNPNNSPIILELTSTLHKTEFIKLTKIYNIRHKEKLSAAHLGIKTSDYTPIYVSEHLTPKRARLYFLARDLAKSKDYKFCWTAYGKIYVRKDENSPIINIKAESQISNLMQAK